MDRSSGRIIIAGKSVIICEERSRARFLVDVLRRLVGSLASSCLSSRLFRTFEAIGAPTSTQSTRAPFPVPGPGRMRSSTPAKVHLGRATGSGSAWLCSGPSCATLGYLVGPAATTERVARALCISLLRAGDPGQISVLSPKRPFAYTGAHRRSQIGTKRRDAPSHLKKRHTAPTGQCGPCPFEASIIFTHRSSLQFVCVKKGYLLHTKN